MDPRIKRRRIAVTRHAGRRRLHVLLIGVGVASLLVGGVAATRSPLLDVDHVVVVGAEHTPAEEVVKAAGLADGPQMLDVDEDTVVHRIRRLPWVLSAAAHREFPATVRIEVIERAEAASVPARDGKWAVADKTGRVLQIVDGRPPTMPSVAGTAPAVAAGTRLGPRGRDAMFVAAALPMEIRSRTVEVFVDAAGELELRVLPTGTIKLGTTDQLDRKLTSAWTVLSRIDAKVVQVLDVRVPTAPVLIRR